MKKLLLIAVVVFLLFFAGCSPCAGAEKDCLRIHIRANSNEQTDQQVKYKVKDAVVDFLTPLLVDAVDKNKAKQIVLQNSRKICAVADGVLESNGFDYKSTADVKKENFPARVYGEVVFDQGEYDALIINLGSGSGDNWWCVVYPPLCFVGGQPGDGKVVYKSKLQEIIADFLS